MTSKYSPARVRDSLVRQCRRLLAGGNATLDDIIPGEIANDSFYRAMRRHASSAQVRTILEIGSSAGQGSTRAFVDGILQNPSGAVLYCMEVSEVRFDALRQTYAKHKFVRPFNVSSVPLDAFPTADEVAQFYGAHTTNLNNFPLETVLGWLKADIAYVKKHGKDDDGIRLILNADRLSGFDMVLIDGSEFTGRAELREVLGAKVIMLDDINSFKNYESYQSLNSDPDYSLEDEDWNLRNGYAIFIRTSAS